MAAPTGACCDGANGTCQAGQYEAECQGPLRSWTEAALCADLAPPCEAAAQPELPIVEGAVWRYFKGTQEPSPGVLTAWTELEFDDSSWLEGPSGFGYGGDCDPFGSLLDDMQNTYRSLYVRKLFNVDDPNAVSQLALTVDYDDSFVAYINGTEVARSNVTGNPPAYNQLAAADHECSGSSGAANPPEAFPIQSAFDLSVLLRPGANVVAIQAHNLSDTSSDFTLLATLDAEVTPITDPPLALELVASGLDRPVFVTAPPGDADRLFIVEQPGRIRVVKNSSVLPTSFLDIDAQVGGGTSGGDERGLLGLAFHPQYSTNGLFYVNYIDNSGNTVLERFSASGDPDVADNSSAATILTITQPYINHNGGWSAFGPDGYLYIAVGDGGSANDPDNRAQDITNELLGKILRIDVDGGTPYAIPSDNPFVGVTGDDEIWAYGLRNPWRNSFDRLTGDLYIGDVGQSAREEVNFHAAASPGGQNYGWRCMEGTSCTGLTGCSCSDTALVLPIHEYDHNCTDGGFALTGGYVYRGSAIPDLAGTYLFADYECDKVWSFRYDGANVTDFQDRSAELAPAEGSIASFGEDAQGELYIVSLNGSVYRIVARNPSPAPSVTVVTPNGGETVVANAPTTIEWMAQSSIGIAGVNLQLSLDGGQTYDVLAKGLPNTGTHTWFPANRPTTQAMILVEAVDYAFNVGQDESDSVFSVESPPGGIVPTTLRDFDQPGSQPFEAGTLNPPEACAVCHGNYDANVEPYFNWQGSMMAHASKDPLFEACLTIANQDAPDSGDLCLRCHTSRGWLQGRSVPTDGTQILEADKIGVSCDLCHRLVDPFYDPGFNPPQDEGILASLSLPPAEFGNGMYVVDPTGARRGPFVDAASGHPVLVSPFHRDAALCGTCHDVSNPAFEADGHGNYVPNDFDAMPSSFSPEVLMPIERTYSEWFYSEYNTPGGVYAPQFGGNLDYVATCQDCHMRDVTGQGCNLSPPVRDDLPLHDLTGGSTWLPGLLSSLYPGEVNEAALQAGIARARYMLQNAATLDAVQVNRELRVTITNETGHKLPTGYPEGRRMWINVKFFDDTQALLSESGAYDPSTGVLSLDPEAKVYEAKPGLDTDVAALLGVPPGPSFHFVLNNRIFKDNRIPPRGFTNAAYAGFGGGPAAYSYADGQYWDLTSYAIPSGAASAEVTLYYQSTSKEYVEFLRDENYTDDSGQTLYNLWNDNGKCPPEAMATAALPISDCNGAADCDDLVACTDDFCDTVLGCQNIDNCPGSTVCNLTSGVCQTIITESPTVEAVGARYLAITPAPDSASVAIRVEADGISCLPRYVDADGYLTDTPVFQSSTAWGTVHVGDLAIIPSTTYAVRADVRLANEPENLSDPVPATTWAWGDVNNADGVNLFDIIYMLDAFQDIFLQATFFSTDLRGNVPDRTIDVFDIIAVLDAFQDLPYPGTPCPVQGQVAASSDDSAAVVHIIPRRNSVGSAESFAVDVFVSGAHELRGYEIALDARVEGRPHVAAERAVVAAELESITVQTDHEEYVFGDRTSYPVVAESSGRLANTVLEAASEHRERGYLGTWVFRVPKDRAQTGGRVVITLGADTLLARSANAAVTNVTTRHAGVRISPSVRNTTRSTRPRRGIR